jgi:hypothetical protein
MSFQAYIDNIQVKTRVLKFEVKAKTFCDGLIAACELDHEERSISVQQSKTVSEANQTFFANSAPMTSTPFQNAT